MKKVVIFAIAIMFCISTLAIARDIEFNIGTGGEKGNYYAVGNDLKDYCPDCGLTILTSDGSVDNLLGMANKKFSAGIVQEDVLQYYAKQNPTKINRNRIKVIFGLYLETAHLLIPKDYKPESGGGLFSGLWDKISSSDNAPMSLDLLKNQTVGSWGGSAVSAKALSYFMDLNMNVVEIPPDKRNSIDMPIILVGGQPYTPVQEYLSTGKFMLIPIDFNQLSTRAPFYVKMDANYKIDGKIITVPTFGVRALLLGKAFRNDERNDMMRQLAKCIEKNLEDLADDPGTNSNWGVVYDLHSKDEMTDWTYFEIK